MNTMNESKQNRRNRRGLRHRINAIVAKLPRWIRGPIVRRTFSYDSELPANLTFKKAESVEEIEQALRIAFDSYKEIGLVDETGGQIRATKYHTLPTTSILIAKLNEEVIATMTIIADSAMGLPIDQLWDISSVRQGCPRVAEISTLAIKRGYRQRQGKLLLPLCGFMHRYCRDYMGVEKIVASFHPKARDFYESLLLFSPIAGGEVKSYGFVKGAAAIGGWLHLAELPRIFSKVYGTRPSKHNLYCYFTGPALPNYIFEATDVGAATAFKPLLTPAAMRQLFSVQSGVLQELSSGEREAISNSYFHQRYGSIVGGPNATDVKYTRRSPRFSMNLSFAMGDGGRALKGKVLEGSARGMKLYCREAAECSLNSKISVSLIESSGQSVQVLGVVRWIDARNNQIGIEFEDFVPAYWINLIRTAERRLFALTVEGTTAHTVTGSRAA